MKLTTTFARLRTASACDVGYRKLAKHLGGVNSYGEDTKINLLTILESNGVQDMLWCLRATIQDSKLVTSQLAIEFAEQTLPIFEKRYPDDKRPRNCIQAARDYLAGKISLTVLRTARSDAAAAAADAAADAAAYAAAAAANAAYAAAADAAAARSADAADAAAAYADAYAYAAANAAYAYAYADARQKAVEKQAEIIRIYLEK